MPISDAALHDIIRQCLPHPVSKPITDETFLREDLGADDLTFIQLAMDLEDETGIKYEPETVAEWVTVGNVKHSLEGNELP